MRRALRSVCASHFKLKWWADLLSEQSESTYMHDDYFSLAGISHLFELGQLIPNEPKSAWKTRSEGRHCRIIQYCSEVVSNFSTEHPEMLVIENAGDLAFWQLEAT